MRRLMLLALLSGASCGGPFVRVPLPAPNPNGCYVMVFDQPGFGGTGDVWNGPGRWSTLGGLRQTRSDGWRRQIRSLRVGEAATVTVFTDPAFKGDSRKFAPETSRPELEDTVSGEIESLELACR